MIFFIQNFGLVIADGHKFDFVTGFELPQFPKLGIDHHRRTDKPTQTWTIWPENNRHIASKVDRANGIGIVMDIGWMQTGFTAVFTCPFRFWSNQADTGTAGVKVNLEGMGKESINVAFGKEIRCAM